MFTGIIEELGTVVSLDRQDDSVRLTLDCPRVTEDIELGDSVAVNGCCLTVCEHLGDRFTADVMQESLDKTSLGELVAGSKVNVERAVMAQSRLGGHIVQGHVDGTGVIVARVLSEHWEVVTISLPRSLSRYVALKGSIAVDGISLTVSAMTDEVEPTFSVSLIPTTLARTTLGSKRPGDQVNLEVDVVAKYVERLMGTSVLPAAPTSSSSSASNPEEYS